MTSFRNASLGIFDKLSSAAAATLLAAKKTSCDDAFIDFHARFFLASANGSVTLFYSEWSSTSEQRMTLGMVFEGFIGSSTSSNRSTRNDRIHHRTPNFERGVQTRASRQIRHLWPWQLLSSSGGRAIPVKWRHGRGIRVVLTARTSHP